MPKVAFVNGVDLAATFDGEGWITFYKVLNLLVDGEFTVDITTADGTVHSGVELIGMSVQSEWEQGRGFVTFTDDRENEPQSEPLFCAEGCNIVQVHYC